MQNITINGRIALLAHEQMQQYDELDNHFSSTRTDGKHYDKFVFFFSFVFSSKKFIDVHNLSYIWFHGQVINWH